MLRYVGVAWRLLSAYPMDARDACLHAHAAVVASTPHVKPELLLAISYTESKFDPMALSRVEGRSRRVGRWESREPPKGWRKGTSLFCGPLQTLAKTWDDCLAQRDLATAYRSGVHEIEEWLADKHVRGNLSRALAGFGCGTAGAMSGTCNNAFQARVLAYARTIEAGHALARH